MKRDICLRTLAWIPACLCLVLGSCATERAQERTIKAQAAYITALERELGEDRILDVVSETDAYRAYEEAMNAK